MALPAFKEEPEPAFEQEVRFEEDGPDFSSDGFEEELEQESMRRRLERLHGER